MRCTSMKLLLIVSRLFIRENYEPVARKIEVIRLGAWRAPVVDEKRTASQSHSDDDVIRLALT